VTLLVYVVLIAVYEPTGTKAIGVVMGLFLIATDLLISLLPEKQL
jgi:hypothetical protein